MTVRWLIAGGGTGGHITPALALGEQAREASEEVLFVGTDRGMETRLVPEAGFELVALGSRPLVGRGLRQQLGALAALVGSTWAAWRTLRRWRPDLVLSVGGYAAVPVTLAATLRRTPVALLEANTRPGLANRLAARFAKRVFVGDTAAAEALGAAERAVHTGLPLRRHLVEALGATASPRTPVPPFRVFVCGGSQGARQVNTAVIGALSRLEAGRFEFVHQTGEADRERVAAGYSEACVTATVIAFERDMASRYQWADLVVCRAGACTLAELALAGRPALLVPLVHTGGGEQLANARARERAGAAGVLDPGADLAEELAAAVAGLFDDPSRLRAMADAARRLARPDAAARVLAECRSLLTGSLAAEAA
jgi:UDP-N-acetylglucosamine--N-acetylmuramyl-(pentapeptide) pyrophosphoryl-undecaprenol N-acetylglucosamine transferase